MHMSLASHSFTSPHTHTYTTTNPHFDHRTLLSRHARLTHTVTSHTRHTHHHTSTSLTVLIYHIQTQLPLRHLLLLPLNRHRRPRRSSYCARHAPTPVNLPPPCYTTHTQPLSCIKHPTHPIHTHSPTHFLTHAHTHSHSQSHTHTPMPYCVCSDTHTTPHEVRLHRAVI